MKNLWIKILIVTSVLIIVASLILKMRQDKIITVPAEDKMFETIKSEEEFYCLTGAFIADRPLKDDILKFKEDYGKKPFIVLIFLDWGRFVDDAIIKDVYDEDCRLMVTWEPWRAQTKTAIDYDGLLRGEYDTYITTFAEKLKNVGKPIFLRFAHEMNGDWYPWSGSRVTSGKYVQVYRHVKDVCDAAGADNVKWVFSINSEDVPRSAENDFLKYYPGDKYTDFVGIDGYNWGSTKPWSKWTTFEEIFKKCYTKVTANINKPVMISEFSSAETGGDKVLWIKDALRCVKKWKRVKAFILFNIDKEAKWSFPAGTKAAEELKEQLADPYFRDTN